MSDIFVMRMGQGDDDERARQEAERLRLRNRYVGHLVDTADLGEAAAERVIAALFDHPDLERSKCWCGCHPRLSSQHDDGFDCPCGWDDARRADERRNLTAFCETPEAEELRKKHAREESAIAEWVAGQPDVEAARTTTYAPEQWQGTVDGHSFYFRERHGLWRIELDLKPSGRIAERLTDVRDDGELVTEPVELTEGDVIAEGVDAQLGDGPVEHIAFIVRTIRDHLWARRCDHSGALFFCPKCGRRMEQPF